MENFNCAVCRNIVKDEDFGCCDICGWEHDPVQEMEPDYRGGANKISLNEARAEWEARKKSSPQPLPQRAVV